MTSITKSRIDFLDFMRIFAFLSVLIGHQFFPHLSSLANDKSNHITIRSIAEGLMPFCVGGAAGVVVFFFISGYIITHVLQKETTAEFFIKRGFRIYPLYIFAVFAETYMGFAVHGSDLPPLSVWVPRLLLLGDFFNTTYSLAGVEWTLRIEIVFYVIMAVLKLTGLLKRSAWLPAIFALCTILLYMVGPFPSFEGSLKGYFTLYGPFLFVGSLIYLAEHQMAGIRHCIATIILIFAAFLIFIAKIHPSWKDSNYAVFALLLFLSGWGFRAYLTGGPLIRLLSELTYSVYLFHNWLWPYLEKLIIKIGVTSIPIKIQAFFALLAVCCIVHRTVEKYGIKLGRNVLAEYKKRHNTSQNQPEWLGGNRLFINRQNSQVSEHP